MVWAKKYMDFKGGLKRFVFWNMKNIQKVKIQSPENICKAFFLLDSPVALLQDTFIYFST
jgi:hypothetical protein